ncbi:pectin acetylesterase 7-like [Stylophora pistillata]|uniref:pectin acetylesterase 7-like n=1 Tax=Stylophora pistillata TaxID=50429 RepID=UPI000C042AA4|nr:pectin acetylesterase 7-like [Stylophora pistillata]
MWLLPISLIVFSFSLKSSSANKPSLSLNWDFRRRLDEADNEGPITDVRHRDKGIINKYQSENKQRSNPNANYINLSTTATGRVKQNLSQQNFRTSDSSRTDDAKDARAHKLHIITNGRESGAVCLDGSPPGFYFRRGSGSGKSKWIVYFQGGEWCYRIEGCYERSDTALGSSKLFCKTILLEGLLSNQAKFNPNFYNWNSIFVAYCDGGSFTGNRDKPLKYKDKLLYFRGHRILDALLDELLRRGLDIASDVIVGGRSAGALAAIIHADYIGSRLRRTTNASFRVLPDAGFILDERALNGSAMARLMFQQMYSLHNASNCLSRACLRAQGSHDKWRCYFPQYSIPFVNSAMFLVNPLYDIWQLYYFSEMLCVFNVKKCNSTEMHFIMEFRTKTLHALKNVLSSKTASLFANACLSHTQCVMNDYWTHIAIDNITLEQAFFNWYRGRDQKKFMIDCSPFSGNPTCPKYYHF